MAKSNAIGWFDLYVSDMSRAVSFYENVLQLKLAPMGDPTGDTQMMSFPSDMGSYGAGGALVKSNHARPGVGGTLLYFSVEDCAQAESRVANSGGKVIRPKFSIGEFGWVVLFVDTEGNMVGLSSVK